MALILPGTRCPICNEKLDKPFTGTSGVAFPPEHPLWDYCDAPLHFDCLESWVHRIEFSEGYFNAEVESCEAGYGRLLSKAPNWILACGPGSIEKPPYYAAVYLREWPFRLYSRWLEWDEFLAGKFRDDLTGKSLQAAEQVMGEVARIAPDCLTLTNLLKQSLQNARERKPPPSLLEMHLRWRSMVFAITSAHAEISIGDSNQAYGVVMDTGRPDGSVVTITAFANGRNSLQTSAGSGAIDLDGKNAEQAKNITRRAQSLITEFRRAENQDLPESGKIYFYLLTTSGLMFYEANAAGINEHPFHEIYSMFMSMYKGFSAGFKVISQIS